MEPDVPAGVNKKFCLLKTRSLCKQKIFKTFLNASASFLLYFALSKGTLYILTFTSITEAFLPCKYT